MRNFILIVLLLAGLVSTSNAQDIITKLNGDEIQAKVTEVSIAEVKYKRFSNLSGPVYMIQSSEIFMIKYEDGDKDLFDKNADKITIRHTVNPEPKQVTAVKPVQTTAAKPATETRARTQTAATAPKPVAETKTQVSTPAPQPAKATETAPAPDAKAKAKTMPVKIKYVESIESGKGISNTTIHLVYYDPVKAAWVDKFSTSNSQGIVDFVIPLNKDGASYSFFYATSTSEVNEKKGKADKGQIYLWRIPTDSGSKYLELWVDKNGMSNKVGSIQMWSKE
ncbi:hypothetical protein FACS189426_10180 [Bacteroidia bacterium]|nr:hypothetical protein FACS189426_10180 [Bacteroidia bacterium]GHV70902.1 hypothetical protein FACS189420_3900 [Bacteroidia bacterium]